MNPYEKIKELTKEKKISVRELEKRLGFSNGYFSKWKNVSPNSEGLSKVADYFGVSIDYLLGRDNEKKDEEVFLQDVLEKVLAKIDQDDSLAFFRQGGEKISKEDAELLTASLEQTIRLSKELNKRKKAEAKKEGE